MYPSCEIRWFFAGPPEGLLAWFDSLGMRFDGPAGAQRVDHYLLIANGDNMGIKLREGNVEVKHRTARLGEWDFPDIDAKGMAEHWIKWSFRLDQADALSQHLIREGRPEWIAVAKERLGYTYHFQEGGPALRLPLGNWAPEGCQVELTRIGVRGKAFYTFGLEAFSDSGQLERNLKMGAEAVFPAFRKWGVESGWPQPELEFRGGVSMGYPAFLLGHLQVE